MDIEADREYGEWKRFEDAIHGPPYVAPDLHRFFAQSGQQDLPIGFGGYFNQQQASFNPFGSFGYISSAIAGAVGLF